MNRQAMMGGLTLALVLGVAAKADEKADVAAGKALAEQTCAACHRVSSDQPQAPKLKPPAPSFLSVANQPGMSPDAVFEFLRANHKSKKTPPDMPDMVLSEHEAEVLTAYIMDLRKAPVLKP